MNWLPLVFTYLITIARPDSSLSNPTEKKIESNDLSKKEPPFTDWWDDKDFNQQQIGYDVTSMNRQMDSQNIRLEFLSSSMNLLKDLLNIALKSEGVANSNAPNLQFNDYVKSVNESLKYLKVERTGTKNKLAAYTEIKLKYLLFNSEAGINVGGFTDELKMCDLSINHWAEKLYKLEREEALTKGHLLEIIVLR
jgi:hypothetical protein